MTVQLNMDAGFAAMKVADGHFAMGAPQVLQGVVHWEESASLVARLAVTTSWDQARTRQQ